MIADNRDNPKPSRLGLSLREGLALHDQALERWRGRQFIGLPQKTIAGLDRATLGLRGLMLLAAAPNVGKTALAVQLGLDAVAHNPDACFLFLSLEMTSQEIVTRMLCNRAHLDWRTLVLGSRPGGEEAEGASLTAEERAALETARLELERLGERILILDETNFPEPTVERILDQVTRLKAQTGCRRSIILVDYLQAFPLPWHGDKSLAALEASEADAWRVGAMKTLRDRTGDAVLVISEVRRPEPGQDWAASLKDVVGSSRTIYTPDMVMLLQPLSEAEALKEIGGDPAAARALMERVGMTFNRLIIAKGRDGVTRDTIRLTFFFRQSRFAGGYKVFV